jgi:hypothetical protein
VATEILRGPAGEGFAGLGPSNDQTRMVTSFSVLSLALGTMLGTQALAAAQSLESSAAPGSVMPIVVEAGRPLRLALDRRTTIKRVGQSVTATLVDPVYVHDRIVLKAGTRAVGHVETLQSPSRTSRLRAMLGGDFSAHRRVSVQFDALVLDNGRRMEIRTGATQGVEHIGLSVAGARKRSGRSERFEDTAIRALPYHRQFLSKGTMYAASLLVPLDFGTAEHVPHAPPGTPPAPDSRLTARLLTPLGSATSPRGTPVEAVLTQPLFSTTGAVILPEGARLAGEVTFSKRAGHFRRSGQLRFLLTRVTVPGQTSDTVRASMHSVESGDASRLSIDEEGGVSTTSSPARFATPALAALALAGTFHGRLDFDTDGAGPETEYGGVASSTAGGFIGMSVFGIAVNQIGRPVVIATTSLGLVRSLYATVFARGAEIAFPADTTLQLQISPASFRRE